MTDIPPPPPGNYPPPPPGNYPPPPPGAFPPPGGGFPPPSGKTNTLATISLVAACVGLCCGIGSIVGIVLGIMARNQIKQTGEGGDGLALAGIIVGAVTLVLNIIGGIVYATSYSSFY